MTDTDKNVQLLEIKNDTMWFSGSPVALCSMCLELDRDKGELFTRVKFQNLKYEVVSAVTFDVICYDEFRNPICRIGDVRFGNVDALRYDTFGYERSIKVPDNQTRNMEYVLKSVVYQDGTRWDNTNGTHFDRKIDQENIYAVQGDYNKQFIDICVRSGIDGTNLVLQPVFDEEFWLCACGAFNWPEEKKCASCRVGKAWLENSTSMTILQKHRESQDFEANRVKEQFQKAVAESDNKEEQKLEFERRNADYQQQQKKKQRHDRRKRLLITAAAMFILAGIAYILMTFVFPKFMQADEYNQKDDQEIVETLSAQASVSELRRTPVSA